MTLALAVSLALAAILVPASRPRLRLLLPPLLVSYAAAASARVAASRLRPAAPPAPRVPPARRVSGRSPQPRDPDATHRARLGLDEVDLGALQGKPRRGRRLPRPARCWRLRSAWRFRAGWRRRATSSRSSWSALSLSSKSPARGGRARLRSRSRGSSSTSFHSSTTSCRCGFRCSSPSPRASASPGGPPPEACRVRCASFSRGSRSPRSCRASGSTSGTCIRTGPPSSTQGTYRTCLKPDDNVLMLPFPSRTDAMLWQAETGFAFRMANGFVAPGAPEGVPDPKLVRRYSPSHRADRRAAAPLLGETSGRHEDRRRRRRKPGMGSPARPNRAPAAPRRRLPLRPALESRPGVRLEGFAVLLAHQLRSRTTRRGPERRRRDRRR